MRLFFYFFYKSFLLFEFEFEKVGGCGVGHASARPLGHTFVPRSSHVECKQKFRSLPSWFLSKIHI